MKVPIIPTANTRFSYNSDGNKFSVPEDRAFHGAGQLCARTHVNQQKLRTSPKKVSIQLQLLQSIKGKNCSFPLIANCLHVRPKVCPSSRGPSSWLSATSAVKKLSRRNLIHPQMKRK
jgi:hypothetical protein